MSNRPITPPPRLRDYTVGDVVVLAGALSGPNPMRVGSITDDYYYLHTGDKWAVIAAHSHPVNPKCCERKTNEGTGCL